MAGRRDLLVHTVELLRTPGLVRHLSLRVDPQDLDLSDPVAAARVVGQVELDVTVESSVDGLGVHGEVKVTVSDECRRCLRPVSELVHIDIEEIYQPASPGRTAAEGITLLESEALDLTPVVRDGVLLALAGPPMLCDPDCAGLCPVCGQDRNLVSCSCVTEVIDERWAALDQLRNLTEE